MKRIKMGLMALAAVSSIGSAFAFSPAARPNATTYYSIKTSAGHFRWTATEPASTLRCDDTSVRANCTIVTAAKPANDVLPTNQVDTHQDYQ